MGAKPREAPAELTTEMLEDFRQVGLRLDRDGVFWHRGEPVVHARLNMALRRWLDRRASDGRPIVRLDKKRYAYVDVEDAFLLIESIRWQDGVPVATLNDGSEEALAVDTLRVGQRSALYALVRERRLLARLLPRAYYSLTENVEETASGFALRVGDALFAIEALVSESGDLLERDG